MTPTPSSESRLKRIDTFLSEVKIAAEQKPNKNSLENLFRKTIEMYYLTEDASLKSTLPEKRIELLTGLHQVSLLAQQELEMSPKGDLAAFASACTLVEEIVLIKQEMTTVGSRYNIDSLVPRLEKCCHKALEIAFYAAKHNKEKKTSSIPFELVFFLRELKSLVKHLESSRFQKIISMIDQFFEQIRPGYEPIGESVKESASSFFTDLIGNVNPGAGKDFSYVRERGISETIVSFLTPSDVSFLSKVDLGPEAMIGMINNGATLKELSFTLDSFKAFAREHGPQIHSLNLCDFAIDTEILDLCPSLRKISFCGYPKTQHSCLHAFLKHPSLANITSLNLDGIDCDHYRLVSFSQFSRLTELSVHDSKMFGVFFQKLISEVPKLQKLDASENSEIGDAISFAGELESLVDFDCSECDLGSAGFQRLVEGLKRWNKIQKLDVFANGKIRDAIPFAGELESLVDFDCSQCSVGPAGFRGLVQGFKLVNRIQTLNVSANQHIGDEIACAGELESLVDFDCSNCMVGTVGFRALIEGLKLGNKIEKLDVSSNYAIADEIACAGELQSLVEFNCGYSNVGPVGFRGLVQGLKLGNRIQKLRVSDSDIGDEIACAGELHSLVDFNCYQCRIGPVGFERLIEGLKLGNRIQKLKVANNYKIGNSIASAGELHSLVDFDCSDCMIVPYGFWGLVKGLKLGNRIQKLDVSHNTKIADGIACAGELHSLLDFDCSDCMVGPYGFLGLVKGLKLGNRIQKLDVSGNPIGDTEFCLSELKSLRDFSRSFTLDP